MFPSKTFRDDSYAATMERLVDVVQELSQARTVDAIAAVVRRAARELTGADGATFVLRDGEACHYVDENAIAPLWKGRRFPLTACISGWVMLNAKSAIIEDIYADARIPVEAYRPTFVKSLVMVPIRRPSPIGAIGNYWANRYVPSEREVAVLQALADTTSVAMENARLYADLEGQIETVRRREALIREQKETLEVFSRSLAHDLKEPVRAIRSLSRMVEDRVDPDALHESPIAFIRDAADRMGMLIDTVFQYTRLSGQEKPSVESFSLKDAVKAATDNLAVLIDERGCKVTYADLPSVTGNRIQVVQVLQNLLSNAIGHCERPVRVDITASAIINGYRCVMVRDDGPGIALENQEKIFEPFRRLKRDDAHSGLGLAICRKIVESHGGKIGCTSTPGNGATFFFTIPAGTEENMTATRIHSKEAARAARGTTPLANLLLVDDREADIYLTRKFLCEPIGARCNILVAYDGKEGLDVIEGALSRGETIDLVLLDLNMPGMDGFETLERIRSNPMLRDIPVVICSTSGYEKDKMRARDLGAAGYMEKPARFDLLKPIIETFPHLHLEKSDDNVLVLLRNASLPN